MWLARPTVAVLAVLAVLALGGAAARADDVHQSAEEPDIGFLEFLGSVDRLSDVMPDYLSQAESRAKTASDTAPAPPAAPRPVPPPNTPNGPGGHNNG
ncbi:MAG TPA: hypothetical protein VI195_07575 [Steroidobacteraceae bacterium]